MHRHLSTLRSAAAIAAILTLAGARPADAACRFGQLHPDAPEETAQYSFLIGEWSCSIRTMRPDGTLGEPATATWTGRYILDGWAIQDTWVATDAQGKPSVGSNIRSFDREAGQWDNRWLASGSLEWLRFASEMRGDRMVMTSEPRRDAAGRPFLSRNTFHDITADAWQWRQDRSFDGGATWLEGVAVIEARRQAGCGRSEEGEEEGLTKLEIPVGDLVFDAVALGPDEAELVLLLHGFPQTSYSWRHQMPALAARGYRAVAPDLRGYSPRARPDAVEAYAMARLVEDVLGMADALGAARFHLVGHDWGGAVAWAVAARHPTRLRTLSVLSTPHFLAFSAALSGADPTQRQKSAYFARFAAEGAERGFVDDGAAGLRAIFRGAGLAARDIDEYVRVLGEPAAMRAALNWYRAVRLPGISRADGATANPGPTARPGPSVGRDARPGTIEVPTLYVFGADDSAFSLQAARATGAYVAGPYRFEVLQGIGHWLPEQAAETVTSMLLEQLGAHALRAEAGRVGSENGGG